MRGYLSRRALLTVPVLLGTTFVIYFAVFQLPGDPIQALVGPGQSISPSVARELRARYHLNEPLLSQYAHYLDGIAHGDFGVSLHGEPVSHIIATSWPVTLKLGLTAWMFEAILGPLLGTIAAVRRGKLTDVAILSTTVLVVGIPYFVIAYVAQIVFGLELGWFPVSGTSAGWPASYVLPGFVLALLGLAPLTRLTRASVLENLRADYIDTAVTKGLSPLRIVGKHVLRNSLIPVLTVLGVDLGYLLGGTVLIEGIFNLPGIGYQVFVGIQQHDGPVVVGISTLMVLIFVIVNLLVDLLYGVLDPRVRS
ncbi:MAG: ABC transporter permease [Jatrophihabitans sp.]